jgi:hypothetical protein
MITRRKLAALHDKYELLLALHEQKPERSAARRQSMLAIAARFPGALREWQALPASALVERRDQLSLWLSATSLPLQLPAWVAYSWDLHVWLRLVLMLRQRPRSLPDTASLTAACALCDELDESPLHPALTLELIAQVDHPSGGQLAQVAYAQVAAQHRVAIAENKAALFLSDSASGGEPS